MSVRPSNKLLLTLFAVLAAVLLGTSALAAPPPGKGPGTGGGGGGGGPEVPKPPLVSTTALDYGQVLVGMSLSQTVQLTNGDKKLPLEISGATVQGAGFAVVGDPAGTLQPGESVTIEVTFSPTATGPATGTLLVDQDSRVSPTTVSLSGEGVTDTGPAVTDPAIDPVALDFGAWLPGSTTTRTFDITNEGQAVLGVQSVTSGDAQVTTDFGGSAVDLAAGQTLTVTVTYAPTEVGDDSTDLVVTHSGPSGTASVPVTATATYADAPTVAPDSLAFGEVEVGGSAALSFEITNPGPVALAVDAITAGDAQLVVTPTEATIAAGASQTVEVTYTPTDATAVDTQVSISHDGAGSPTSVPVTGTGVAAPEETTAAAISVTPSGSLVGASTYGSDTITVTNTGTADLTSVSLDLSTALYPDIVFDPVGTAGDATAQCLVVNASDATATGYVSGDQCVDPFSQEVPGAPAGYQVLTLAFTDFGAGESVSFAVDVDPTSILGFDAAGNAGAVSGVEMAGATLGAASATETVTAALVGAAPSLSHATAVAPATATGTPVLTADGLTPVATGFSNGAEAVVTDGPVDLTVTVPDAPDGTTVLLQTTDATLEDLGDAPFDIDDFEANKAVSVGYLTGTTVGGTATFTGVQVAATAGSIITYAIAHTEGRTSTPLYLAPEPVEPGNPGVTLTATAGGSLGASTFSSGSFVLTNTSDGLVSEVTLDLSTAVFPGMVFDPAGLAGDTTAKCLEVNAGGAATGLVVPANACTDPFSDGTAEDGYTTLSLAFTDFGPGESLTFAVDIDPVSIKGETQSGNAGSVSGLELSGSGLTAVGGGGSTSGTLFGDGSSGGAVATAPASPGAPTLTPTGVATSPTGFSNGAAVAVTDGPVDVTVADAAAADGTAVTLLVVDGTLEGATVPVADYVNNAAIAVDYLTGTFSGGVATFTGVTVPANGTYLLAQVAGGAVSDPLYLFPDEVVDPPTGQVLARINAGGPLVAAVDGGPDWEADTAAANHPFLANPGSNNTNGFAVVPGQSVPGTTPDAVFTTERWDAATDANGEMLWSVPVPAGTPVAVRLYMGNGFAGTSAAGQRVFDVTLDDVLALDDLDLSATYGHLVGVMIELPTVSDGSIDLEFLHGVENPLVNAIEVVSTEPQPGVLGATPSSIAFGTVLVSGGSATQQVRLSNLGADGDPTITISSLSTDSAEFTVGTPGALVLAPGESTTVDVTFDPSATGSSAGSLSVVHDGTNAPVTVQLSGTGTNNLDINDLSWNQANLAGEVSTSPTTLDFGPDGRLYVGQFTGDIYAYEIAKSGDAYIATDVETISLVKNIPNHDDQGVYQPNLGSRLMLGLTVVGTAENPVIYATSSHAQINAGAVIDTNSGALSKLTRVNGVWEKVDLVYGLPRSQHDHAVNGVQVDEAAGVAYIAVGGNTNQGASSNNLDQLPEYALSAALVSVDLDAVEAMSLKTEPQKGNAYRYAIPTIEGGTLPWGGKAGANQAQLVQGGPVQIHSPGYRNIYDNVLTDDGKIFVVDNGPNSGWGAPPNENPDATVENGDCVVSYFPGGGESKPDQLHLAAQGFYGGHPNVTRGNPTAATNFPGAISPTGWYSNPEECDYKSAGTDDALATFGASTNGITEYTSGAFGGALQGALITASFNGDVWAALPTADGTAVQSAPAKLFTGFGSQPLDVTAQGDDEVFPGTVWAVTYGANLITVWEPLDGGGGGGCDESDPAADPDGDGYTNEDELLSGTGPCNNGSRPADADGDLVGDVLDTDDDNDGLADTYDPFALDPDNGASTPVGLSLPFAATDPRGGILDTGLTGLMTNATSEAGGSDYMDLFDADNIVPGGAAPVFTVSSVSPGDAYLTPNDQENGFQVGVAVGSEPFLVRGSLSTPTVSDSFQSLGVFLGDGTQSNYLKMVVGANGSNQPIVQVLKEVDDVVATQQSVPAAATQGASTVDLYLEVTPGATEATVVPSYVVDGGTPVVMTTVTVPMAWFSGPAWLTADSTLAVGLISTSTQAEPFSAGWRGLEVLSTTEPPPPPSTTPLFRVNAGGPLVASTDTGPDWGADALATPSAYLSGGGEAVYAGTVTGAAASVPAGTPQAIFATERYDSTPVSPMTYSFPVPAGTETTVRLYLAELFVTSAGARLFDVSVDGAVPSAFDDIDRFALGGGIGLGAMVETSVVSDGTVDLQFAPGVQNPAVNAIEILVGEEPGTAPTITADATAVNVSAGTTAVVGLTVDDPDADVSILSGPAWASLDLDGDLSLSPTEADVSPTPYPVTVQASNAFGTSTEEISVTVVAAEPAQVATFRVNAGGGAVPSGDDGPDWSGDTTAAPSPFRTGGGAGQYTTAAAGSYGPVTSVTGEVDPTVPLAVFDSERYNLATATQDMTYSFPVTAGAEVTVRLYLAELFNGISAPGLRVFDVAVDGTVPVELDDLDRLELAGGGSIGTVVETVVTSDGSVDLSFLKGVENPAVNAIEILTDDQSNTAPTLQAAPQVLEVAAGATASVDLTAGDVDGNQVLLDVVSGPAWADIDAAGDLALAPGAGTDSTTPYTVTVQATDLIDVTTVDVTVTVTPGAVSPVVYRINAGGPDVAATDGGPSWSGIATNGSTVPGLTLSGTGGAASTSSTIDMSGVAGSYPGAVCQTELWGPRTFDFAVANGTYDVTLLFAETYGPTSAVGARQFDVALEGATVLTAFDVFAEAGGANVAISRTFRVDVTDGQLLLQLLAITGKDNPAVKGIEITTVP